MLAMQVTEGVDDGGDVRSVVAQAEQPSTDIRFRRATGELLLDPSA